MKQKIISAIAVAALTMTYSCGNHDAGKDGAAADSLEISVTPPYTIQVQEYVNPNLPDLHSYTHAIYKDKIIMIGGRTNGLHGGNYDFEQSSANKDVFVIDTKNWAADAATWEVHSMPDTQIPFTNKEQFRANNAQFFTDDEKGVLYIIGGLYGSNVHTKLKVPKDPDKGLQVVKPKGLLKGSDGKAAAGPITLPYFTAVDLKALVDLVMNQTPMPANAIRQAINPDLAATGGELSVMDKKVYLVFGWDFSIPPNGATGDLYSHKIKSFNYTDNGQQVSLGAIDVCPTCWDNEIDSSNTGKYRRRDGSLSAMIDPKDESPALIYYAGVFKNGNTNFDSPVWIGENTASEDPFVMRSNVYTCQVVPAYSKVRKVSYATLLGGMTNAIYNGGAITQPTLLTAQNAPLIPEDTENFTSVPFSNQFSTLAVTANHTYSQYLLPDSFPNTTVPTIFADTTLPAGSVTYNGAESEFLWTLNANLLPNGVIDYDSYIAANPNGGVIGYVHGGIQSVLPNLFFTKAAQLTVASNRIFSVKLVPLQVAAPTAKK